MEEAIKIVLFLWWMHGVFSAQGWATKAVCLIIPPMAWCASIVSLTAEKH